MPEEPDKKLTVDADADVNERLEQLDPATKSHTINELLRQAFDQNESVQKRLADLESRLQALQNNVQVDAWLAAIRQVLSDRFGESAAAQIEKEFNDIYNSSTRASETRPTLPDAPPQHTPPPVAPGSGRQDDRSQAHRQADHERSSPGFTDKGIKVITLAQEEARRLGHNFVGTEQILLGLVGEVTGIAARALKGMGANLKDVRSETEKIIGRGEGFVAVAVPFTPQTQRLIELAWDEARRLDLHYIDTEHLLLVLIREGEGVAVQVLVNLGIDLEKLQSLVRRLMVEGVSTSAPPPATAERSDKSLPPLPEQSRLSMEDYFKYFTNKAAKVMDLAQLESKSIGHNFVGTEHLLLGLRGEGTNIAAKALIRIGVCLQDVRGRNRKDNRSRKRFRRC